MRASNSQIGYLSYFLRSNFHDRLADYSAVTATGKPFNAPLRGAEKWMEENLDRATASTVIGLARAGHHDAALGQLVHLGLPLKH